MKAILIGLLIPFLGTAAGAAWMLMFFGGRKLVAQAMSEQSDAEGIRGGGSRT